MKENMKHRTVRITELDPTNDSHWISHNEWLKIVAKGAPKPLDSSVFANDWAANNPTPQAKALLAFDPSDMLMASIKGITTGARPVEL